MKKMINNERIEGRIYQHNLVKKTVQNQTSANYGKEFISGNIEVAVDEEGLIIIPVHFTYVVEQTSSGNKNATYANLDKIINGGKTWITNGKDEALKVRIDTALAVNDFYTQDDRLVSTKVNEGGFVSFVSELCPENERNTFTTDMLITGTTRIEADPERNIEKDYVLVKGAIFNFRNALLPVDFIVKNEEGMNYFEDLNASQNEPVFTKVWGRINCGSIANEVKEETAFGEEAVRTFERKIREWVITGTSKVPYEFDDDTTLTIAEVQKAMQDRELMLAETKKRSDEYKAQKAGTVQSQSSASSATITPTKATFNF
jgi:hypothetical protein